LADLPLHISRLSSWRSVLELVAVG
jgi:hypothetical protein